MPTTPPGAAIPRGLLSSLAGVVAGLLAPKKPADVPAPVQSASKPVALDWFDLTEPLVKDAEGLSMNAYLCPAGVPTIGWGHTAGVKLGQTITLEQAEAFLREDLGNALSDVKRLVKVPLSVHQTAALVSWVFNLGAGNLAGSTLLHLLNERNYRGAADEFGKWTHGGGKVLPGLVKRRAAERALFLTTD